MLSLMCEVNINAGINHLTVLKYIEYSPIDFEKKKPNQVIVLEYAENGSLADIMELERRTLAPVDWDNFKK